MTNRERDARDELWAQAHGPNGAFTLADEAVWYAGYTSGFSRARAAEPPQSVEARLGAGPPVGLGGMVEIADPVTGERIYRLATDDEKRRDAERRKSATEHEVACYLAGWRARGERFAAEPPQPASVGLCAKCLGSGSIPNGNDEMACGVCTGSGKPAEPPHPGNEELVANLQSFTDLARKYLPNNASLADADISEIERRLTVKP